MPDNEQIVSDGDKMADCEYFLRTLEEILGVAHKTDVPDDLRFATVCSKVRFLAQQQKNPQQKPEQ